MERVSSSVDMARDTPASGSLPEDEKLRSREAELTALSQHLMLVAEEEKAQLARELHDTFGSNLTAINMDLNWIARRLPEDRADLRERLQRALRMLVETVLIKQEVIDRLRPSQLDTLGLAVALRSHCREQAKRCGVECEVKAPDELESLDRNVAIALYRLVQDTFARLSAGEAGKIQVDLSGNEHEVRLRIHDEGGGLTRIFNGSPIGRDVTGMKERIRGVGGTLRIELTADALTIEAVVPLRSK